MSIVSSYNNTLGGPVEIQVEDGRIRRIRPITLRDDDPEGWVIRAHGRAFTPPRKVTVTAQALQDKTKPMRMTGLLYPMIREDFVESPDGKNRTRKTAGKPATVGEPGTRRWALWQERSSESRLHTARRRSPPVPAPTIPGACWAISSPRSNGFSTCWAIRRCWTIRTPGRAFTGARPTLRPLLARLPGTARPAGGLPEKLPDPDLLVP